MATRSERLLSNATISNNTPPGNRKRALSSAVEKNHLSIIVKLVDPSIVLIEDPTDEDSRGIIGSLSASVYFSQDTQVCESVDTDSLYALYVCFVLPCMNKS